MTTTIVPCPLSTTFCHHCRYGMDELTRDSNMLLLVLVCIFSLPMALNRSLKGLTHVTPFSLLRWALLKDQNQVEP